jgi:lysosomal acid lipase/cholesteryl ester hydrolase
MIVNRGYPVEIHHVVTEDGYILELHRIPYSRRTKNRGRPANKKVVFFQHGLMATDSLFVINPTDKCLGTHFFIC